MQVHWMVGIFILGNRDPYIEIPTQIFQGNGDITSVSGDKAKSKFDWSNHQPISIDASKHHKYYVLSQQ